MRKKVYERNAVFVLVAFFLLSLIFAGCRSTIRERKEEPVKMAGETTGRYYHFEDVRIPRELNYQQKKTMVYETTGFKAGVLYFTKWRLDIESLIDFFTHYMEKDNWKLVNSFKGKESIFNFSKSDRTCTIKISETWLGKTEVEIRVGPLGEKKM